MQTVAISITALTKEEVAELPVNTQVLMFNSLFDNYYIKRINKTFLKRLKNYNKYVYFFIF